MLRLLLVWLAAVPSASLLLQQPAAVNAYTKLQGVSVTRASDATPVELTSLWRPDVFGLGGERAAVVFLRHFGWVFCWELALQLKRDVLPALEPAGVKLFAVGIGSAESAATFADKVELDPSMVFADESDEADAYTAVGTRNTGRDGAGKQIFEGVESMWSEKTNAALKARGRDDLNSVVGSLFKPGIYTPLMPKGPTMGKAMERTFVQGGTFVFDGSKELFAHYDFSSGDHADLDELVRVATAR